MAFKIFVGALLAFAVGNFIFFLIAPVKYHFSLRTLRKGLYTLFIGAVSLGLLVDEIKLSNWQFLITLATAVIFVDLAILLTPSIMKLWKAEFQYSDYVEDVIETNTKILRGTLRRVATMSDMIQNAGKYFEALPQAQDEAQKNGQLEQYLELYATQYGFSVQIWDMKIEAYDTSLIPSEERVKMDADELVAYAEDLAFMQAVNKSVTDIERLNSFELGSERDAYVESLFNSEIISLIKSNAMIVPVYMEEKNMVIVLKNTKGELLEADAVHIANLIYLFYSLV